MTLELIHQPGEWDATYTSLLDELLQNLLSDDEPIAVYLTWHGPGGEANKPGFITAVELGDPRTGSAKRVFFTTGGNRLLISMDDIEGVRVP